MSPHEILEFIPSVYPCQDFVPTNRAVLNCRTPSCNCRLPLDLSRQILWPPAAPYLPSQAVIHSSDEEARTTAHPHPQSNLIPRSTLQEKKGEVKFPLHTPGRNVGKRTYSYTHSGSRALWPVDGEWSASRPGCFAPAPHPPTPRVTTAPVGTL
jgi:hypothetical protein